MSDTVKWSESAENDKGIETIAFEGLEEGFPNVGRIIGYNGILKGDKVKYQEKDYTVVMVSRLGHFGLSETGELPYTIRVYPKEVTV